MPSRERGFPPREVRPPQNAWYDAVVGGGVVARPPAIHDARERGPTVMHRLLITVSLAVAAGCSATEYNQRFDASLQQYRADSAAGRKGRAVARPVVVDGSAAPVDGVPAGPDGVPPGAVPPAAPQ